jgi:hypothetical protein
MVLRSIESKIEGLFEGIFGRAFRTHVQPIELARKLVKEMNDHRSTSVSRVYVPNEYTVYLSTPDREQFRGYEDALVGELQEYLAAHAARERFALLTPPTVLLTTDDDLAVGEFGIATRIVPPAPGDEPTPPTAPASLGIEEPAQTMVYKASDVAAAVGAAVEEAKQEVVTLTVGTRVLDVTTRHVVIGRSRECEVRLEDSNASRRHAELRQEGATYWLSDLGSTNGTELNGRRIARERLSDGDRITVGATEIVFNRSVP